MTLHAPAPGRAFRHAPQGRKGRARTTRAWDGHPLAGHLDRITLPATGAWAFGRIPKTGTHTVLAALHELEFGTPISTAVADPANTADDTAPHLLDAAGLFYTIPQAGTLPDQMDAALRFTVIRQPVMRALSGFAYLGRSHAARSRHLAPVRLRMTALTGFDWGRDPDTAGGFDRFLDFIALALDIRRFPLDGHIAPQSAALPADAFAADLTGRTEELGPFLTRLAKALDRPPPPAMQRNATPHPEFALSPDARRRCEALFAADMDWYERA
ncbi:MAG: sulfotransferase family enzyme [Rhodobacteraceae bacterium HLUCCA08]|nr:MAG: sulfotransferase family enzyme [Rhodobacteraceae bacterium HLUCCA08]